MAAERPRRLVAAGVATVRAVHARSRAVAVDQLAAGIAYFAFLALVPLLLLATAAAGFVLDDVAAQRTVADAVTAALPGLEAAVEPGGALDTLLENVVRSRGALGVVGGASLLLVALRLAAALMAGVELTFGVPRATGAGARLRQLGALTVLGVILIAGSFTGGLAAGLLPWLPGPLLRAVTVTLATASDVALFLVAYRTLLTAGPNDRAGAAAGPAGPPWRVHLPGALLGAAGWGALKLFGATFVTIRLQSAGAVYGTLAGVATVLVLLYAMARLFLTGAVLSAVRAEVPPTADTP